ncbi:MAG: tryptophan--tRNA ligase [Candidatus Micrarchaeia archaeon]
MKDAIVNAYEVKGTLNYDKLINEFGLKPIDEKLLSRIKEHTGDLHPMLRRGIFSAQRDLNFILDQYEKGNKFYLYTGIAPSGSMTIGHLVPFMFTKYLQDKFDVELIIQIPDEEKALMRNMSFEDVHKLAYEDALDIIALGFDPKKTKIFFNTDYAKTLYPQAVRVAKHITFSMVKDSFGFTNQTNIGSIFYTSMQAVPAFLKSVQEGKNIPCLITLAIDQDVHFRIARDAIAKLGYYKPATIECKFLPSLNGSPKMSSHSTNDTIYLNDSPEIVKKKVFSAFTGQQPTLELQRKYGGDPDKCVVCQYNKFIFEPDDKKLKEIMDGERNGTLTAGEHKVDLTNKINAFLEDHNKKKEKLRDTLEKFIIRD